MYSVVTEGSSSVDNIKTVKEARQEAKRQNEDNPKARVELKDGNGITLEIWVGPCTFMPIGKKGLLAYSSADLDSIGAVRNGGKRLTAMSRGVRIGGSFASLYDASVALDAHARSSSYIFG